MGQLTANEPRQPTREVLAERMANIVIDALERVHAAGALTYIDITSYIDRDDGDQASELAQQAADQTVMLCALPAEQPLADGPEEAKMDCNVHRATIELRTRGFVGQTFAAQALSAVLPSPEHVEAMMRVAEDLGVPASVRRLQVVTVMDGSL